MTVGQLIKKLEKFDRRLDVTRIPALGEDGRRLRIIKFVTGTNRFVQGADNPGQVSVLIE